MKHFYVFYESVIPMDKDLSGIARSNGDEFHIWKWQIRALLQYKKVFGLPVGTDLEANATDEVAWKEREYLAYSILCNSIERKILGSLLDCKTSREIWTTLLSLYEQNISGNLHDLQKKFFQATILPEQSITDFIASLNLILSELAALGDKTFNEHTMISKLFSSLPEGFDHFLTSWESTPVSEQTLTNLKLHLIKEEQKSKNVLLMKLPLLQVLSIQTLVVVFLVVSLTVILGVRIVGEVPISGRDFDQTEGF